MNSRVTMVNNVRVVLEISYGGTFQVYLPHSHQNFCCAPHLVYVIIIYHVYYLALFCKWGNWDRVSKVIHLLKGVVNLKTRWPDSQPTVCTHLSSKSLGSKAQSKGGGSTGCGWTTTALSVQVPTEVQEFGTHFIKTPFLLRWCVRCFSCLCFFMSTSVVWTYQQRFVC